MTGALEAVFAVLAVAVVAFAGIGALLARKPLATLHFLAPLTTLAVPLFAVAVMLNLGLSLGSATVAAIAVVVAVSGPAVTVAIGRTLAEEQGIDVGESPE